jgi:hypothetical protein
MEYKCDSCGFVCDPAEAVREMFGSARVMGSYTYTSCGRCGSAAVHPYRGGGLSARTRTGSSGARAVGAVIGVLAVVFFGVILVVVSR